MLDQGQNIREHEEIHSFTFVLGNTMNAIGTSQNYFKGAICLVFL